MIIISEESSSQTCSCGAQLPIVTYRYTYEQKARLFCSRTCAIEAGPLKKTTLIDWHIHGGTS